MKNQTITQPNLNQGDTPEVFPDNYEPKLPLVFVVDVSTSMAGEGIDHINKGLKAFEKFFIEDPVAMSRLEVSIVTFGTDVKVVREFAPLGESPMPVLKAGGRSLMIEGMRTAVQLIDIRKQWYKRTGLQYYRPYIIMITDGSPWPNKNLGDVPEKINESMNNRSFVFQAFGAGKANMKILNKLSHADFKPQKISGYNFNGFFNWLMPSISTYIAKSTIDTLMIPENASGKF